MNDFIKLNDEQKRYLITQTNIRTGLPLQVIEKDLWVTAMLQIIFSLPLADKIIFKGGTSLSKVWGLITRFSEDIDLAIDREVFGEEFRGDLSKRNIKKLRKASSTYVRDEFCNILTTEIKKYGLADYLKAVPQNDGFGDGTYPEPRKIFIHYPTLFGSSDLSNYICAEIVLEISSRSLIEPFERRKIKSIVSETLSYDTDIVDCEISTAMPAKTFLEKAFLLHELFSTDGINFANRKSRHLYDLEKMMNQQFAVDAIVDNELWNTISHHREIFTPLKDVDYSSDIRDKIVLIPPTDIIDEWRKDYEEMKSQMIYGDKLTFDELIVRITKLQAMFRNRI